MFIFFSADWCPHSKKFRPIFGKAARALEEQKNIKIAFMNGPKNKKTIEKYGVKNFPTQMFVKHGVEQTRLSFSDRSE